jgi:hypothetical protein
MFVSTATAMRKRRMLESPSCAVEVMQQPDLGRLGRFTGGPGVTLGDIVLPVSSSPAPSSSGFSISPWLLAGGVALLLGALWYRSRMGSGAGFILPAAPVRRRRSKRIPMLNAVLYAAGAGAGGYLLGKSLK